MTVEARGFVESVVTGRQVGACARQAWSAAEVGEAIVASAADGAWRAVAHVDRAVADHDRGPVSAGPAPAPRDALDARSGLPVSPGTPLGDRV